MHINGILRKIACLMIFSLALLALDSANVWGHCNRENGPVAKDARKALEKEDFQKIAIWVSKGQADELRTKYKECLNVYEKGGKSRKLAESYFVETAIRLHRKSEGMAFTGVKPASPLPPDIAKAEKALKTGELNPLIDFLSQELKQKTQKWFRNAMQAKKHKNENLGKGREWVDAYVKYVIYVHGLYQTIQAGPKHGMGE